MFLIVLKKSCEECAPVAQLQSSHDKPVTGMSASRIEPVAASVITSVDVPGLKARLVTVWPVGLRTRWVTSPAAFRTKATPRLACATTRAPCAVVARPSGPLVPKKV
ncbi:hypothetical protein D9M68_934070 [compost metagenome]